MLKIAICDDDVSELDKAYFIVSNYWGNRPDIEAAVYKFLSPYELFETIEREGRFQLYLLDILMPQINGIDAGTKIRHDDENAVLVYLTSSPDYALDSYKLYAFQYLLKPINKQELHKVLDKVTEKLVRQLASTLPIKTKNGIVSIPLTQIIYVEYNEHRLSFCLTNGNHVTSLTIRESFDDFAGNLMQDECFAHPHASFLVNLRHVRTLTAKDMLMVNQVHIPVSRKKYAEIKKQYIDFVLKGGNSRC